MESIDIELLQFAPRFADPAANLDRIRRHSAQSSADLILTPELSLTGYDLGDLAADLAQPLVPGEPWAGGVGLGRAAVLIGAPERGDDQLTYNCLVAVRDGVVQFRHRKIYLPTYGTFDEGRFWARGRELEVWSLGPWRIGVLICEDLWHPALAWVLATRGIHLLLVAAAAPGRGIESADSDTDQTGATGLAAAAVAGRTGGGERPAEASRFESARTWERLVRVTAHVHGVYVALANRTGVEGAITFAGGSILVGPDGRVLARAADHGDAVLSCRLSMADVARARRPFAHLRDDDAELVIRALARGRP